jgi:hypothetical protein
MSLTCGNAATLILNPQPREAAWRLVHAQDLVCSSDGKCYEHSFDEGAADIVAASKNTGKPRRRNSSMSIGKVAYFFALLFPKRGRCK